MIAHRFFWMCQLAALMITCNSVQLIAEERMTPELLWKLGRVGQAEVSPDGRKLVYTVTRYDLEENSGKVDLVCQDLPKRLSDACSGTKQVADAFDTPLAKLSRPKMLLSGVKGLNSVAWIERPEGLRIVYIAPTKDDPPTDQAFMITPEGDEPQQITHVKEGISNLKVGPAGDQIAFTVDVKLDSTVNDVYKDLPKADARIIDSLMYRHWNAWHDYAYSHVFVAQLGDDSQAEEGIDLMKGLRANCPLPPFGGSEQFTFSPDGNEMALSIKLVNNPAESTDSSIFLVSTKGGPLKNITPGMPGYDLNPTYSPDGRTIAFSSMERPGFEADRNRIMVYDRDSGTLSEPTAGLDQTAHSVTWAEDSQSLFFDSETRGTHQAFRIDVDSQRVTQVSEGRFDFAVLGVVPDQNYLLVTQQSMLRPVELAVIDLESSQLTTLTDVNRKIFADLELPIIEERFVTASDGAEIQNWIIWPPEYDAESSEQWPMLTYCQGGPQGQIGQWFSYRWNFHLMAAQGYAVLAVNRRGLPGFGQQWNDQISGDWGGQAMQDILAATDAMMSDPHIDRRRVAAVGASFGGYTAYWLMGNAADRFCAIIAHCGVFNLESMYGSTEELFFVNWDLGGPYWRSQEAQEAYNKFSPHRFVGNWKTPLLIIHSEKDFRVPLTQGIEAFTAAQTQGVPSRFLYFPNEDHWVKSPQNSVLWNRVFFEWLDKYCK